MSSSPGTEGPQKAKGALWKQIAPSLVPKSNSYKHQPIDSRNDIRILRIFPPGKSDKELGCELLLGALPSAGRPSPSQHQRRQYVALSYCWGDSEAVKPIQMYVYISGHIDGKPVRSRYPQGVFYVRENLDQALRNCRRSNQDVDIWVDAICINQKNLAEKADQVNRMKDVYHDATEVWIWLGAGKNEQEKTEIKKTFEFMREILDFEKLDAIINTDSNRDAWQTNIDNLKLVVKLIKNPWFGRRWIIQELALAKIATIRWDTQTLLWSEFADAMALLMTKYASIREMLQPERLGATRFQLHDPRALGANTLVNATLNLFRRTDDGEIREKLMTLEMLVSSVFVPFQALNPRDTIYAALSLSKDTDIQRTSRRTLSFEQDIVIDSRIAVDYDKSWRDTCAGFMEYCIERSKSLDILCRHWAPGPGTRTLEEDDNPGSGGDVETQDDIAEEEPMPSWILPIDGHGYGGPNGVHNGRINADSLVGGFERENKQYYNASGSLLPWFSFGKTQDSSTKFDETLEVKGCVLGVIEKISNEALEGIIPSNGLELGGLSVLSHPEEIEDLPDKLWRTLVADRGPEGTTAPTWYRRACLGCLKHRGSGDDLNTDQFDRYSATTPEAMKDFISRVRCVVWKRKFFLTRAKANREPLFGLAPGSAETNDRICILFGCSVPVVLRKLPGNRYKFVGECYVHGKMDGEAIPDVKPK
ncbi:Heterokaryon incompatibility protein (HET) domain containing protein [Hyaloscypha variabilis]